jgi:hypothetical protein
MAEKAVPEGRARAPAPLPDEDVLALVCQHYSFAIGDRTYAEAEAPDALALMDDVLEETAERPLEAEPATLETRDEAPEATEASPEVAEAPRDAPAPVSEAAIEVASPATEAIPEVASPRTDSADDPTSPRATHQPIEG